MNFGLSLTLATVIIKLRSIGVEIIASVTVNFTIFARLVHFSQHLGLFDRLLVNVLRLLVYIWGSPAAY